MSLDDNLPRAGLLPSQWRVTDELKRVAEPLLIVKQKRSPFDPLSIPPRLGKPAPRFIIREAVFVLPPPLLVAPKLEEKHPVSGTRLGQPRFKLDRAAKGGGRIVRLPLILERVAQVDMRLGQRGLQVQCMAETRDRFVQLPLLAENEAEVIMRLGKARL